LAKSNGSGLMAPLMTLAAVPMNSVYPSLGARTVNSAATLEPPPGRFSTTICWPSVWPMRAPRTRAVMSAPVPGPKPTIRRIGRDG
jgi:hypothetical protein